MVWIGNCFIPAYNCRLYCRRYLYKAEAMTLLEIFKQCTVGVWVVTDTGLSYKKQYGVLYFQSSREKQDWKRNLSIMPAKRKIGKKTVTLTRGWAEMFDELISIPYLLSEVKLLVGYSHGAVAASLLSELSWIPAITFGCPMIALEKKLFCNVRHYKNPHDIVTAVPFFFNSGGAKRTLGGTIRKPSYVPLIQWITHHHPAEYRQRLEHE